MQIGSDIQLALDKLNVLLDSYSNIAVANFLSSKEKIEIIMLIGLLPEHENLVKLKTDVAKYLFSNYLFKIPLNQIKEWFDMLIKSKDRTIRQGAIGIFEQLLPIYEKRMPSKQSFFVGRTKEEGLKELEKTTDIINLLKGYIKNKEAIIGTEAEIQAEQAIDSFSPEKISDEISSKLKAWLKINPNQKVLTPEFGAVFYYLISPYLKSVKVHKTSSYPHIVQAIIEGTMEALARSFPVDEIIKFIIAGIIILSAVKGDEDLELASYIISGKLIFGIKKYGYTLNLCTKGMGKGIIYLTLHGMTEVHLAHYKDPYVYNFIKESLFSGAWDATLVIYNSVQTAELIAPSILKGMSMEQDRVNGVIREIQHSLA